MKTAYGFVKCVKLSRNLLIGRRFLSYENGYKPRRTLLYVPGTDDKKVKKAAALNADVVVLDCEDGVALSVKDECRQNIQKLLPSLQFGASESAIRINSIDSEHAVDDIKSVFTSKSIPQSLMVPKIESVDQIKWLKEHITEILTQNEAVKLKRKLNVIGQTETPKGMMNLREILEEASFLHENLQFEAFVFGSDDFLASIGAQRTPNATELLFARQYFIMHVKGYGFQAIDMVDINFKDLDGLKRQSEEGMKMGFTGKQVIHPAQIDVVNEAFSPTKQQLEYAEEMLQAFQQHQKSGKGAFTFRNAMIDMPSVKQAMNILNLSRNSNNKDDPC